MDKEQIDMVAKNLLDEECPDQAQEIFKKAMKNIDIVLSWLDEWSKMDEESK